MGEARSWVKLLGEVPDENAMVREAFRAARIGVWSLDAARRVVSWSGLIDGGCRQCALDTLLARLHPDERAALQAQLDRIWREGGALVSEQRLRLGGAELWLLIQGRLSDGAEGRRLTGIAIDITERKLRERKQLRGFIDALEGGVALLSVDGRLIEANRAARQLIAGGEADIIGHPLWEILRDSPSDRQHLQEVVRRAAAGEMVRCTLRLRGAQEWRTVNVHLAPLTDERGAVTYLVASAVDITSRLAAERERSKLLATLEAERARLAVLLDSLPVGVVVGEAPSGKITVFNRRAEEILGHSLLDTESIEDYRRYGAVHEDGRPYEPAEHPLAQVLLQRRAIDNHVMHYRRPDGSKVLIDVNAAPVFDEAGRLLAGVVTLEDITERQRTEQLLRQQMRQQEAIAQLGQEALAADDLGSFFAALCSVLRALLPADCISILELTGQDSLSWRAGAGWQQAADGRRFPLAQHPLAHEALQGLGGLAVADDAAALAQPSYFEGERVRSGLAIRLLGSKGPFGCLELYSRSRRRFSNDERQFVRAIAHILSELIGRKQSEAALIELNASLESRVEARTAELQALNKELEAFAYSVSHDLRAPLRGIDGFSQALLEDYGDSLDDTARRYLERVRAGAQRMGQLIDELLAFSRLSRSALRLSRVDLAELARQVVNELRELEPARQVRVTIEPELWVTGDANLLAVALHNLFSNAWKFTRYTADAAISFGRHPAEEGSFVIRDNGAGFDMLYADKLFGAFQRLHTSDEFEGTGIGLANVQRIIHRHGGRIWAEGEVGKGAAFYFTLGGTCETTGDDPAG